MDWQNILQFFDTTSTSNKKGGDFMRTRKKKILIFRPYTTVNGKKLFAPDYGLKAWPIWI